MRNVRDAVTGVRGARRRGSRWCCEHLRRIATFTEHRRGRPAGQEEESWIVGHF
jgi:hypothetical protein